jgi:hypothetical protein
MQCTRMSIILSGLEIVLTKMRHAWTGLFRRVSSNGARFSQKCNVCSLANSSFLTMNVLNLCQFMITCVGTRISQFGWQFKPRTEIGYFQTLISCLLEEWMVSPCMKGHFPVQKFPPHSKKSHSSKSVGPEHTVSACHRNGTIR